MMYNVFLNYCPFDFRRQGVSQTLSWQSLDNLTSHLAQSISCPCLLSARITGRPPRPPHLACTWILGISTLALRFSERTLYPLSHIPNLTSVSFIRKFDHSRKLTQVSSTIMLYVWIVPLSIISLVLLHAFCFSRFSFGLETGSPYCYPS